ncbi:DUF72 domain-containing protein [Terracoccus luteus]|uniref:Uncharacterized protein YecE (DUF72 family) n=1 Tax=Terracoccus luteus TaxID=53356 RepID=A0A839PYZ8_9MICO|nr:DUF72 domain-containing protein [Terracoccus luteus]MBB2986012.1 uncharacterized protein YecE (DUF72 family) [Terracoccus luteus]MCP2171664.1 uncharacterized protein YecE (DUF72 family) [Terracoccus luteus]
MSPRALVGVSGWRYPRWRGDFYPTGLPQRLELTYAAERMTSVELNGSFYSLQRPASYAGWYEATPPNCVLAVKGGRFVTHLKRLRGVEQGLANFFASGVLVLGEKLGPVLWQLPETIEFDPGLVGDFLALLPRDTEATAALAAGHDDKVKGVDTTPRTHGAVRHALEPRHPSFDSDRARALCAEHGVAIVVADSAGRWPTIPDATSDFRYVRLHGETELYASGYTDASLDRWARQCETWLGDGHDVHVYFDNDARGHAPHDAVRLLARLGVPTAATTPDAS